MKVAYLINDYPKVSHSFIRREILALERREIEVQRVAIRGWSGELPDEEDLLERGRTRYVLQGGLMPVLIALVRALLTRPVKFARAAALALRMTRKSDRGLAYHLVYLAEACRILPWLIASGAERIHAHFATNSTDVAMLVNALGGPPYSFTVHGWEEFVRPVGLSEKIRRADLVVAISCFGRSQLYMWTAYRDWPKIKVVHCGLERAFYEGSPSPLAKDPRLVCVGRLAAEKGQLLLVEAVARLAARGIASQLVFAGDGPMRTQLEELIHRRGLDSCVRITGWISSAQVRAEILAARALVLPSFAEGLPVVLMEAMALRRPVLATFIAGIPELVSHGENGWLVPASSLDALTTALEDCLLLAPKDLERMGENAYRTVIARHSIDTEAAKLADLFKSLVKESART